MENYLEQLLLEEGKNIRVYLAKETITDPYEKTVSFTVLNPITIKGLVQELTPEQIYYKLRGVVTVKALEITCLKKYRSLLEKSYKIEVDGTEYLGYKQNSKMNIREEKDSIRFYVYIKN